MLFFLSLPALWPVVLMHGHSYVLGTHILFTQMLPCCPPHWHACIVYRFLVTGVHWLTAVIKLSLSKTRLPVLELSQMWSPILWREKLVYSDCTHDANSGVHSAMCADTSDRTGMSHVWIASALELHIKFSTTVPAGILWCFSKSVASFFRGTSSPKKDSCLWQYVILHGHNNVKIWLSLSLICAFFASKDVHHIAASWFMMKAHEWALMVIFFYTLYIHAL